VERPLHFNFWQGAARYS